MGAVVHFTSMADFFEASQKSSTTGPISNKPRYLDRYRGVLCRRSSREVWCGDSSTWRSLTLGIPARPNNRSLQLCGTVWRGDLSPKESVRPQTFDVADGDQFSSGSTRQNFSCFASGPWSNLVLWLSVSSGGDGCDHRLVAEPKAQQVVFVWDTIPPRLFCVEIDVDGNECLDEFCRLADKLGRLSRAIVQLPTMTVWSRSRLTLEPLR